jgi:hypothetical protein
VDKVNDFVLTPEKQRGIYKGLLLADYQMPKELTLACNMKPHIRAASGGGRSCFFIPAH